MPSVQTEPASTASTSTVRCAFWRLETPMVEIATPTPNTNAGFNADWASPPVDLIEEVLEELGLTRAELAQRLDFSSTRP